MIISNYFGRIFSLSCIRAYSSSVKPTKQTNEEIPAYGGLSFKEVEEKRHKFLSPSLQTYFFFPENPFYLTRARMQYIYDANDTRYVDLTGQNTSISVGHNHPRVVAAIKRQMESVVHCSTMFYNESPVLLAEQLVATVPNISNSKEDWVVHLVSSGSEAVDLAIMLARAYTGNFDVLALRSSYHGLLSTPMGLTGLNTCKQNIAGGFGVKHCMNPDMFRGQFAGDPQAPDKYAQDVRDVIQYSTPGKVAAFIFEPVIMVGGLHPLPQGYLPKACEYVREAGGLIISDEVQTGNGRPGSHFWAVEKYGVQPDIIVTGKGLSNGLPIGAVMMRREVAESMAHKVFFSTYGSNPTVCAAATEVMRILREDKTVSHITNVAELFLESFLRIQQKYPSIIGDVRALGLLLALDVVKDPVSRQPDRESAQKLLTLIRERGVIMTTGGLGKNVLRMNPPLCVTPEDVKLTENAILESIETHYGKSL
ncbi:alanine--glyoxylate aminotransferase 2, mitochondrial isoform X1 [Oopsacas minuta]|uniref:Alanine--glyoxylate aminotransferase 2, mitochondrial n=1 Tax=Oopsacas minuta TaxID=111878 RepID=A0AAV7K1X3_9METZ|nr:alanine--glyoxylate aminotransferase 2, mitochondrial isoform X1 [Oopsacas minuta]